MKVVISTASYLKNMAMLVEARANKLGVSHKCWVIPTPMKRWAVIVIK